MGQKNMFFANQLKKVMFEKKLTQKELAKKIGNTQSRVSGWLTGVRNPSLTSIKKLASALDLPINFFVENSGGVVNTGSIGGGVSVGGMDEKDIKILKLEKEVLELKLKLKLKNLKK